MLNLMGVSLAGLLLGFGQEPPPLLTAQRLSWQEAVMFQLPLQPDPTASVIAQQYLEDLAAAGVAPTNSQGIWFQAGLATLAEHQGKVPRAAASLTKVATTLASLEKWGAAHTFMTRVAMNGTLVDGILQGDLIVIGGSDPLFVWEEAITLGNSLNELGITIVTGDLIIGGDFTLNFKDNATVAGHLLQQAFNAQTWTREIASQHGKMKPGTPRPQIQINGGVKTLENAPDHLTPLVEHTSLNLAQILKFMNLYSNNALAESLAEDVGGAKQVAKLAAAAANIPPAEIQLINGSGLGTANRISPRAVIVMLQTIERKLRSQPIGITDLFPVAGRDAKGTMQERNIPQGAAVKTGTLREVSALAGVLPTRDRGQVWFAIINGGGWDIQQFRNRQDALLGQLTQVWGVGTPAAPTRDQSYLGDPARNHITQLPSQTSIDD